MTRGYPRRLSLVREFNAIAVASSLLGKHRPASLEEKALLTYWAMSNSDDLLLLLEREAATADDAVAIAANGAFRRASGYSNDQLVGRSVAELFPRADHAGALMTAIRSNGSLRSELGCIRLDGAIFTLGMHLMPAPARTPGSDCFVILGRDITAVLQARQTEDFTQRLLTKVFTSVDAPVAIVNGAGRIVMTNPQLDGLLGYKPNGLVGLPTLDLVAPEARARVEAVIKQQIADGRDSIQSAPVRRADGSELIVRITSVIATAGEAKKFRILTLRPEASGVTRTRLESVGHIKLVGLDEVRSALGERWAAVAGRAMATAEAVIKKRCGPEDSFSRADETSFLVCFGRLSEEESAFRAAMISREIRNRLIGQGETPDNAYVRSIAARIRVTDQSDSNEALQAALLDGLDRQLERIERESRQVLRDALAGAACDLCLIHGRNPDQVVAGQVLLPQGLERRIAGALCALPAKEAAAFDLDGLMMGLAAQAAVAGMARGEAVPLLVKISFDIFATRATTERFFAVCEKIDRRVTSRLVLLLSSVPNGVPQTRLQDCVNRLRPFCRGVGYQVDEVAELPELDLANSFNPIVVLPVTACLGAPSKVRAMFGGLQARRAKILVCGIGSEEEAAALLSLGVDMVAMKQPEFVGQGGGDAD
jgi:PAS domain S-box-containing protein